MTTAVTQHPRSRIYYWKCDRPAAFHGTEERSGANAEVEKQLLEALRRRFSGRAISVRPAATQGNHLTWLVDMDGESLFARVENGPEGDDHLEVESRVIEEVRAAGVPAPRIIGVDARRVETPFAWQLMQRIEQPDLNSWLKRGSLDFPTIAFAIGAAVAKWQQITPRGFGPFSSAALRGENQLRGYHEIYADYFQLHLERHVRFLNVRGFLSDTEVNRIHAAIADHHSLLKLSQGCLVHKDLALWNILGTETTISAFIDWDDAIGGDPMDDLSLLACFHDGTVIASALKGYVSVRALPTDAQRRFWLHLLRNMLVKAVIRVGAGYFDRTDSFFLIGSGSSGADLKTFTHARMMRALDGLKNDHAIDSL